MTHETTTDDVQLRSLHHPLIISGMSSCSSFCQSTNNEASIMPPLQSLQIKDRDLRMVSWSGISIAWTCNIINVNPRQLLTIVSISVVIVIGWLLLSEEKPSAA